MASNLPTPDQAIAGTERPDKRYYDWFLRIQRLVEEGNLTEISQIATALGSPDGTVAGIPSLNVAGKQDADPLLDALAAILGDGLVVRHGPTMQTRAVAGGTGISVANGSGTGGNPTVSLADLADSGTGTFKLLTRDAKGRLSGTADGDAADVPYDNTTSGLTATTVQGAIDEVVASSGGTSVTLSDTAPASPSAGAIWGDTSTGTLYIYFNDGTSSQWVQFGGSSGAASGGGGAIVTWNPSDKGSDVLLSNFDLTASGPATGIYQSVRATSGNSADKRYFEVRLDTTSASNFNMVGICTATPLMSGGFHTSAEGFAYYQQNGQKWTNNTGTAYGVSYTAGDIIGVAHDGAAGRLEFFKNNVSQGVAWTTIPAGTYFPALSLFGSSATRPVFTARFKAADFTYAPPTGYSAWGI